MIAASHPGKIGDALYALPTIKSLAIKYNCKVDFYTSEYCRPLESLFRRQSYINDFIVMKNYRIENFMCGVQPWNMNVDQANYDKVFELGFCRHPDKCLSNFIAESVQVEIADIEYEFDDCNSIEGEYVVLAARGDNCFLDFIKKSPFKIVQIGGYGDFIGLSNESLNKTGLSMLDVLPILKHCKAFVGQISSQLVLANAFDIPKIAVSDGSADGSHLIYSSNNFYTIGCNAEEIIYLLDIKYSSTLYVDNYFFTEAQHISNIEYLLRNELLNEHHHRRWEMGLGVRLLRRNKSRKILNISNKIFTKCIKWLDIEVDEDYIEDTPFEYDDIPRPVDFGDFF